jgi:hypothetical protein
MKVNTLIQNNVKLRGAKVLNLRTMRQETGSEFTNGFMSFENLYHNEVFLDEFVDGVLFEGDKILFSVAKHCFIQRPVVNRSVAALDYQIWGEHCVLERGDVVMYGRRGGQCNNFPYIDI